ncbi:UPF0561 protein C2orf68 homolog isoform X1 [Caretta caretta]|uniref:UPF0561 protein C2orf68 homolog isoform X1 n=1 Tax=Caretta caretta TaxID=8467 RepID=UPI003F4B1A70
MASMCLPVLCSVVESRGAGTGTGTGGGRQLLTQTASGMPLSSQAKRVDAYPPLPSADPIRGATGEQGLTNQWHLQAGLSRLPAPPAPSPAAAPGLTLLPIRDDYDREMKQAKEKVKKRHTPTPPRPRKPDQQVYRPCRRSRVDPACGLEYEGSSESSSSTEPDPRSTELFCLEYEADSGEVTSVIVHQDDSPEEVTEKVCAQSPLEPPLHEALRQRVQEELRKRRAKR